MTDKRNKLMKVVGVTLVTGLGVFSIATYILGSMVYEETVGVVKERYQHTGVEDVMGNKPNVVEAYYTYEKNDLMIPSENGYEVEAQIVFSKEPTDQTIVLVHGIGTNMWAVLEEGLMYLENGFNIALYNQRYTGKTGGDSRTFGLYERNDLAAVVNYVHANYEGHLIGVHGFSMGAGTAGMYSEMSIANEQADFIILDCPYDSMTGAIYVGVADANYPIPTSYIVWSGDMYNRLKNNFSYSEVDVKEAVSKSEMPIFVIHGEEDVVCPVEMGEAIYDAKVTGYKELWIEEGAQHVALYDKNPEKYEEKIMSFIEKVQDK